MAFDDMESDRDPRVAVLGPVTIDGVALRGQQAALIEALVFYRRTGASTDLLVDALWYPVAPATARQSVQNQVNRLRSRFGADVIETRGGRYHLGAATDLDRFVTAMTDVLPRSTDSVARSVLARALDLWRGDPFDDLDGHAEVGAELALLQNLRATGLRRLEDLGAPTRRPTGAGRCDAHRRRLEPEHRRPSGGHRPHRSSTLLD